MSIKCTPYGALQCRNIPISGDPNGWELIAVDGEGGQVNWQNLNLTGVSKITLHADGTANLE